MSAGAQFDGLLQRSHQALEYAVVGMLAGHGTRNAPVGAEVQSVSTPPRICQAPCMPRKERDTIGRDGVFKRCRAGLPRTLARKLRQIIGAPFDERALGEVLAAHMTLRRQLQRGGATSGQSNEALRQVAGTALKLTRNPDPQARERLDAIIDALDDRTAPMFREALELLVVAKPDADHWKISTCSLEDIAAAAMNAQSRQHGPLTDAILVETLAALAPIYEQATGKAFTHFKYKAAEKTNESQSVFGRFATTFLTSIDPQLKPKGVSNGIDRLRAQHVH